MNALTTRTQSSPPARTTSVELTPGLKSLLTTGDGPSAIDEIARNPVMLAEAKGALDALMAAATVGAGPEGVRRVIGRRLANYPPRQMSDGEWAMWWRTYIEALADLPEAAIEAGMVAWIKRPDSEWLPKPGALRALAKDTPNAAVRAAERARAAIARSNEPAPKTPVAKEAVDAMLADFRRRRPAPPAPTQVAVPPAPETADLSPAMRERLQSNG